MHLVKPCLHGLEDKLQSEDFPLKTTKRIHILVDGEKCLYDGLAELFPKATFSLDIYHVEKKYGILDELFIKKVVMNWRIGLKKKGLCYIMEMYQVFFFN